MLDVDSLNLNTNIIECIPNLYENYVPENE